MVGLIASPWPVIVGYAVAVGLYILIFRDIAAEVRGE